MAILRHFTLLNHAIILFCYAAIEEKEIHSKIPLTEVLICGGFFLISFLEELIHHFIHPHKKTTKSKIHRQCGRKELNQRNEFELYDQNWRNANKIVPSIDATNITCAEEGTPEFLINMQHVN